MSITLTGIDAIKYIAKENENLVKEMDTLAKENKTLREAAQCNGLSGIKEDLDCLKKELSQFRAISDKYGYLPDSTPESLEGWCREKSMLADVNLNDTPYKCTGLRAIVLNRLKLRECKEIAKKIGCPIPKNCKTRDQLIHVIWEHRAKYDDCDYIQGPQQISHEGFIEMYSN